MSWADQKYIKFPYVKFSNLVGQNGTNNNAVSIGSNATGYTDQGDSAVAIGIAAGSKDQKASAVAIGLNAGATTQGGSAVAIGAAAGKEIQGGSAVAIGTAAGSKDQKDSAVAIGLNAGAITQGASSIAIGKTSGQTDQGIDSIAIGSGAGTTNQGENSIAIGYNAGKTNQGANSIAIGYNAGKTNQVNNTIVINAQASGTTSTAGLTTNATYIAPMRPIMQKNTLFYDTGSSEITYYPNVSSSSIVAEATTFSGHKYTDFFENGLKYRCHIFYGTDADALTDSTSASTTGIVGGTYVLTVKSAPSNASIDICIIGGGGSGGKFDSTISGGGGGAGSIICAYNVLINPTTSDYQIHGAVGSGGINGSPGTASNIKIPIPSSLSIPSVPLEIIASGGGRGASNLTPFTDTAGNAEFQITSYTAPYTNPRLGGSNGGLEGIAIPLTSLPNCLGPTNVFVKTLQTGLLFGGGRNGNIGSYLTDSENAGGGGGGHGEDGGKGAITATNIDGGKGGTGISLSFDGTVRNVCYGGGGGAYTGTPGIITTGGSGDFTGGTGGTNNSPALAGVANTGSGGGGGGGFGASPNGASGGSGIVMIRYIIG